jgi:hypothetical protein
MAIVRQTVISDTIYYSDVCAQYTTMHIRDVKVFNPQNALVQACKSDTALDLSLLEGIHTSSVGNAIQLVQYAAAHGSVRAVHTLIAFIVDGAYFPSSHAPDLLSSLITHEEFWEDAANFVHAHGLAIPHLIYSSVGMDDLEFVASQWMLRYGGRITADDLKLTANKWMLRHGYFNPVLVTERIARELTEYGYCPWSYTFNHGNVSIFEDATWHARKALYSCIKTTPYLTEMERLQRLSVVQFMPECTKVGCTAEHWNPVKMIECDSVYTHME